MLSVIVITLAFRLLANSSAFNVRIEYLGKLIPMITSLSPICTICSNSPTRWRYEAPLHVQTSCSDKSPEILPAAHSSEACNIDRIRLQDRVHRRLKRMGIDFLQCIFDPQRI